MAKRKFNIPDEEYVVERPAELTGTTKTIKINDLLEDEDNAEIYGENEPAEIAGLVRDIKQSGFKGAIMVYPVENGFYKIESGHRRVIAAKEAGLVEIPVIITEPPKTDAERRMRLISMNLHTREDIKPMRKAYILNALIEAIKEEYPGENRNVSELVGLSENSVYQYLRLLRLSDSLKELVEMGVAWSAITQFATLTEEQQDIIANKIKDEINRVGSVENVPRSWILSLKEAGEKTEKKEEKPRVTTKRRDGAKILTKCAADFDDIISGAVLFKPKDKELNISNLEKLRDDIDKTIERLKAQD